MSPTNTAAWQVSAKAQPLEVKEAPYPTLDSDEIIIRAGAVAVNPVDWTLQEQAGGAFFEMIQFPCVLGHDVAGEVVEVGADVTRFQPGDRVLGMSSALLDKADKGGQGVFQHYVVLEAALTCSIPRSLTFEDACVLPICLATAASGLFQSDYLNLQYPCIPPKPTGKTLLVWGAATSVGSNGVQLAVAAGYEVIATASAHNFDYAKKLGATTVFDYNSPTVITDIVAAFKGKDSAGALACAIGANEPCLEILKSLEASSGNKFVAAAWFLPEKLPEGVEAKFIDVRNLKRSEACAVIFEQFLPKALEQGTYLCMPEAKIVGKGLGSVQLGLKEQKAGVSARKVVISL